MMARNSEEQDIGSVLKAFVKENKLDQGLNHVNVKEVWYSQMGPAIKKYTTTIRLKEDTLIVSLSSSVLREELSYGKEKIIRMLNESLGQDLIKKLILR
ncbi:DUF721 domain-containing protein [Mesonia sp. HuA40]|uniref:DUF721 domain-containing protein n=1 Tax=Mesonia sp. HuA40 TaxID=2602761 RepID=UPI00351AAFBF